MEYKVNYTNHTTKEVVKTMMLQADDIRQARATANNPDNMPDNCYCKVYNILNTPEAITEASTEIVKRTTANMISREGGDIQYRLYNAIRQPHPTDPDIMDCLGVVNLALWEYRNEDTETAYKEAYKALNAHLYESRQIRLSVTAMRTVYIEDIDGDIINVNKGINAILEIEIQGGMMVKEKEPDTVMIFVVPPSMEEHEKRLRGRGTETEEVILQRLARAKEELLCMKDYEYIVVNNSVEEAAEQIRSILACESLKTKNMISKIEKELGL